MQSSNDKLLTFLNLFAGKSFARVEDNSNTYSRDSATEPAALNPGGSLCLRSASLGWAFY